MSSSGTRMILRAVREGLGRVIILADFLTRPRPVSRSETAQRTADQEAGDMALYQFYACPFCVRTRRAIRRLNLPIPTRDAQNDQDIRHELLEQGGEIKVPCLRINDADGTRWMYESVDIIAYLESRFS